MAILYPQRHENKKKLIYDIKKLNNNNLIKINLWNCFSINEDNYIDIHIIFLHLLIVKINIGKIKLDPYQLVK